MVLCRLLLWAVKECAALPSGGQRNTGQQAAYGWTSETTTRNSTPSRGEYELKARVGTGVGGEQPAVRDHQTHRTYIGYMGMTVLPGCARLYVVQKD
jgi:hypothetical protein